MSTPSVKEIEEELQAIRVAKYREEQARVQVEEFRTKLREMKKVLEKIKTEADPERSQDMKEVCLFTIHQCNEHIVH